MKIKSITWFSVCTFMLIMGVQYACIRYALHSLKEETDITLNESFKSAFGQTVNEQLNKLPYADRTLTHIGYAYIDSLGKNSFDRFSIIQKQFIIDQQTSTILQDRYGMPEISMDSLLNNLEKELSSNGVNGMISVLKLDVKSGKEVEYPSVEEPNDIQAINSISEKAYLNERTGTTIRGRVRLPINSLSVANSLLLATATSFMICMIIGVLWVQIQRIKKKQKSIETQRQRFYQQAKRMSLPVQQLKEDIISAYWELVSKSVAGLLASVQTILIGAKKEYIGEKKRPFLWGISVSFLLIVIVIVLWGYNIYEMQKQRTMYIVQQNVETAFLWENAERLADAEDVNGWSSLQGVAGFTDAFKSQLDSLSSIIFRPDTSSTGAVSFFPNPDITYEIKIINRDSYGIRENWRMRKAYEIQHYIEKYSVVPIPLDSVRMDSSFNALLKESELANGTLYFYNCSSDSLVSQGLKIATRPIYIKGDRSEWMQGAVQVPFIYIIRSTWYLFLPLALMFLLVLFCACTLWGIARKQKRLEQFVRDFTYAMIHDMKSPLQSVLMGAQILASGRLPEDSEKAARIRQAMRDECDHLLTLSNRVITLTQMERGELELHRTDIPLYPLFEDLAAKFRLKAPKPVAFDIACDKDLQVNADAFCLREVLSNLIDNAIKYSREEVAIHLSAAAEADGVVIRVRDNGIGIPPREQQRIFGKFERVSSGCRATGTSGFGLGLNFVWQVVWAHGGRVEVRSDGRSYSEFAVVLPG